MLWFVLVGRGAAVAVAVERKEGRPLKPNGQGVWQWVRPAAVTSTFSALRLPFAPEGVFSSFSFLGFAMVVPLLLFHFWLPSASAPAPDTASASCLHPCLDSGRHAMHIQLTFQLKSLCEAATKGAPTKRKASKIRTSSELKLSVVQTPG